MHHAYDNHRNQAARRAPATLFHSDIVEGALLLLREPKDLTPLYRDPGPEVNGRDPGWPDPARREVPGLQLVKLFPAALACLDSSRQW